ncbi:hypothetical protein BT69DRAFT_1293604 [Atractiella rhizophila]|nr:hypothetical protein BT69DRAFT_1293604 [Atractiella rhizophila]
MDFGAYHWASQISNTPTFKTLRESGTGNHATSSMPGIEAYLSHWHPPDTWNGRFTKWARLQLPLNEIVRTRWKELQRPPDEVHISRQIKYKRLMFPPSESAGPPAVSIAYAEVLYFHQLKPYRDCQRHDPFGVLTTCQPALPGDFDVVNVTQVQGVVAVIPRSWYNNCFIVERLGGLGIETD